MVSVTVAMVGVQIETVMTLTVGTVTVAVTGGRVGGLTVTGGRGGGVKVTVTVELVYISVVIYWKEGKRWGGWVEIEGGFGRFKIFLESCEGRGKAD